MNLIEAAKCLSSGGFWHRFLVLDIFAGGQDIPCSRDAAVWGVEDGGNHDSVDCTVEDFDGCQHLNRLTPSGIRATQCPGCQVQRQKLFRLPVA